MTREEYVDDILLLLGEPLLEIELSKDDVGRVVDMAFRELKHYITDTETLTIPYREKFHLEDFEDPVLHRKINVNTVVYVMRSNSPNRIADYQDIMYLMNRQSMLNTVSLTDYNRALLVNQAKNTISTDLDFHWDKKYKDLYVYANYPKPESITITYIPEYETIEDIEEPFWQDKLRKLAKGLTKETLGRIRSKYTLNGAQYTLDGNQLLAEAQQELSDVRSFLNENSDMLLPVD